MALTPPVATREIEHEVEIEARPETVFKYFTDPERMVAWMGSSATLDPRPGGACRVGINRDAQMSGEFIAVEPYHRLVFSWGWESGLLEVPPESTVVEVSLTPRNGGTHLRLVHRQLPPAACEFHQTGWGYYLDRLAVVATGDDPGPDRFANDRAAR